MNTLEICVDNPRDLATAIAANVDRIELCSALDLGGLTPTLELIEKAKASPIPIYAMIRPRGGDFVYSAAEIRSMEHDIALVKSAGFAGVVFGALNADRTLDLPAMNRLCAAAEGMGMTLHRAVDEMPVPSDSVPTAIDLGFERILTSGGADKAINGVDEITKMVLLAADNIEIMAGSGVSFHNIKQLNAAGVWSFHASCREKSNGILGQSINNLMLEKTKVEIEEL